MINYTFGEFEKPIHHLDKADMEHYFQIDRRESNLIEFKSYFDDQSPNTTKAGRDGDKVSAIIRTLMRVP